MKQLIAGQFILLALSVASFADTLYVSPQSFIADVIAESESGDVIILEPGLHQGPVIPYGRNLTIGSRYLLDHDSTWIALTVVQAPTTIGDSSSAAIFAYNEPDGKLFGLTLRGSSGTTNVLYGPSVGGCVYIFRSRVTIQACRLTAGETILGAGVFVSDIPYQYNACLRVIDSLIDSCHASNWGGGIFAANCTLTVERTSLWNLTCDVGTGGLDAGDCVVTLDSLVVTQCFGNAAGIELHGGRGNVSACTFMNNSTPENGLISDLDAYDFWGTIRGCTFRDTEAPWPSVGIGGPYGRTSFIGNVIENYSTTAMAGALAVFHRNDNIISHNIFRNNQSILGGVVYAFSHAYAFVEYNTFIGNSCGTPAKGSVLHSVSLAQPRFSNNIISNNVGNCVAFSENFPLILDVRNNWWGDASGPYHAELNPQGHGDTLVGDSVTFIPWLTSPPDTTQPTAIRPEPVIPVAGTWDLQSVFPNPFNNAFTVSISGFAGRSFKLSLFNVLGQKIADLHSGPALGGLFSFAVSAELSSGVYFLVAHDEIIQESIKVVLLK